MHCRKSDLVHIVFLTEGSKLCWWMTAGKHSSILLFSFLSPLTTFTITAGLKFGRRTQLSEVATTPHARLNKIVSEPQRNIGNRPTVLPLGWQVKCAERRIASFQHVWMVTATSSRYQVARILRWFSTIRRHCQCPVGPASYWNWTWQQQMWETCRRTSTRGVVEKRKKGGEQKKHKCSQVTFSAACPAGWRGHSGFFTGTWNQTENCQKMPFRNVVK